jgi:hypothetical protein
MDGKHPFSGVTDVDVPNLTRDCIQKGIFPYATPSPPVKPPPNAPDFDWLPPALGQLFLRAFITGFTDSHRRPSAGEWQKELKQTVKLVRECGHYIHDHVRCCPWCEQENSQSNIGSQAGCAPQQTTPPQAAPAPATPSVQIQPAIAKPAAGFRLRWIFIVVFGVWIVAKFLPPSPQSSLAPISVAPTAVPRQEVLTSNAVCQQVQKGSQQMIVELSRRAQLGDVEAQACYGESLLHARGMGKDIESGLKWLNRAASRDNIRALTQLGSAYAKGNGVGKDCGKAFDLISRARDAGSIEDISNLGVLYQMGCGTSKDKKRAFELFLEGAYKGDKFAMRNLADAYVNGLGVKSNVEQAFHWAKESEKLGNPAFQMVVDAQKKR